MNVFFNPLGEGLSQALRSALSHFYRSPVQEGDTLNKFLNLLSTDFVNRVENVVRAAFDDENFIKLKTDIIAASTAFRTYNATQGQDIFQLDIACARVLNARSLLFASSERFVKFDEDRTWHIYSKRPLRVGAHPNPAEEAKIVSQNLRGLEASMSALHAIANLDILTLSYRADIYPGLVEEIRERIKEYEWRAIRLKNAYVYQQVFRVFSRCIRQEPRHFEVHCYRDGVSVQHIDGPCTNGEPEDTKKKFFECLEARGSFELKQLEQKANEFYDAPGNLAEAIQTWDTVVNELNNAPGA